MQLEEAIRGTFGQLQDVLGLIGNDDYGLKSELLNGASIGEHYRHLLEMFICLNKGYQTGIVNYDDRVRDKVLEQSKEAAMKCMAELANRLERPQKGMILRAGYVQDASHCEEFSTSYYRELAYALEHAVHHMALIRIGLKAAAPQLQLPESFGVAHSTIKYRNLCAR